MKTGDHLNGKFKVLKKHLAIEVGSGTVPVLATPALIGFMENIASDLAQKSLAPSETTVGFYIEAEHLSPTARKQEIYIHAQITGIQEKIITFQIEAHQEEKLIGKAVHKRAIINRKEFEKKI